MNQYHFFYNTEEELREKLKSGVDQLTQGKGILLTEKLVKDIQRRGRIRRSKLSDMPPNSIPSKRQGSDGN